jgi:outer membrane immunogenic protein
MKKLLLASVATSACLLAHAANAADVPSPILKAAPAPVPVYSWTGCYVGAQAGWGLARNKISQTQFNTIGPVVFSSASSGNIDSSGAMFGGQVGCDYQFTGTQWVIGVQGSFFGTDLNQLDQDPHNGVVQVSTDPLFPGGTFGEGSIATRTKWLGSVTGRLGYAVLPDTLLYIKGGGAWTENQIDLRNGAIAQFQLSSHVPIFNTKHTGWTVGAGAEWKLVSNWTLLAEYNYYDFKSKHIFTEVGVDPLNVFGQTLDAGLQIHTFTVGVNYRFNWGAAPVVAKY